MTRGKKRFYLILAIVVVALSTTAYFRIRQTALEASRAPRPAPIVELALPLRRHLTHALTFTGDVLPIHQASIYSRVTGNIERMYEDIGSRVREGQMIALVDTNLYAQTARQTFSQWKQAEAALENARLQWDRAKNLVAKELISKQEMENAETAYKVAKSQSDAAEATYRNASTTLSYCRITAPFTGSITKRFLDPGAYVNNVPTATGSSLYTLMNIDTLKVLVNVLERDVSRISQIRAALIRADAFPDSVFTGIVRNAGDAVDLATRTFPLEVDIPNHDHILKPGMFATTRLVLEEYDNALTVPADAVITADDGNFVFTLAGDSTAHKVNVTPGISQEGRTHIVDGLDDQSRIIVQGQQLLRDGIKVRVSK